MNEAIKKIKQGAKKLFEAARFTSSLPQKEVKILVAKDNRREVMQEFEIFY